MQASVSHILPLTMIRRARLLPVSGRVLVRVGQKVSATDVVAEANVNNPHILLDIRRALRLSGKEDLRKIIDLKVGDKVQEGDILAEKGGLFKRVVRAPSDGAIVSITSGQIMLETEVGVFELKAGLTGEVMEVIPEKGVILEAHGALLQGVWGNGQTNTGMLLSLAKNADDELTFEKLDMSMRGAIILAGHCSSEKALLAANDLPLRGLILGSMSAELVPVAKDLNYPIILLEGFGKQPLNSVAFRILSTNEKREVSINASPWDTYAGVRPEVVIPLPATGNLAPEVAQFKPGQTVRIRNALQSKQIVGVLEEMLPGLTLLQNGLRVPAANVRLENNEVAQIPLVNLDVLD